MTNSCFNLPYCRGFYFDILPQMIAVHESYCFFRFPADFDVGEVSAFTMWQLFIHDLGEYLDGILNVINFSTFSFRSSFTLFFSTLCPAFFFPTFFFCLSTIILFFCLHFFYFLVFCSAVTSFFLLMFCPYFSPFLFRCYFLST